MKLEVLESFVTTEKVFYCLIIEMQEVFLSRAE